MADTKITNLAAQTAASGDELAANRAGADCKLLVQDVAATLAAASDTVAGKIELAIQAEQETGTDVVRAVVPGRQHFHPSAPKFWVKATANSTTMPVNYNMTSWADTATGIADGTIANDFSGADWCGAVTLFAGATAWDATNTTAAGFTAMAAGTFKVAASQMTDGTTAAAAAFDGTAWHVMGLGDL